MKDRRRFIDTAKISRGSKVLDVGTGDGFFALWSARKVGKNGLVIAIDISSEYVKKAHEMFKKEEISDFVHVIKADLRWIPLPKNALDVAMSYNFISSINIPSQLPIVFSQLKETLTRDGRIIAVDYVSRPKNKHESLFFNRFDIYKEVYKNLGKCLHVTFFTPEEIKFLLEKLDFKVNIKVVERNIWMPKKILNKEIRDLIQEVKKKSISKKVKTHLIEKLTKLTKETGEKGIKIPSALLVTAKLKRE